MERKCTTHWRSRRWGWEERRGKGFYCRLDLADPSTTHIGSGSGYRVVSNFACTPLMGTIDSLHYTQIWTIFPCPFARREEKILQISPIKYERSYESSSLHVQHLLMIHATILTGKIVMDLNDLTSTFEGYQIVIFFFVVLSQVCVWLMVEGGRDLNLFL